MANGKHPLRTFTAEGFVKFDEYVSSGALATQPPPIELLHNDRWSAPLGLGDITVKPFKTKFDMGMSVISDLGRDKARVLFANSDVWPWLSLLFNDSVMPKTSTGWKIGARSRHILEKVGGRKQDQAHRHLVRAAVYNIFAFNQHARVMMEGPDQQAKIEEQIMSRRRELPLAGSEEVIKVIHRLYWDAQKSKVRKGAKGEGAGSIMRFIAVVRQLDATYDIVSMQADQLAKLLPKDEFGRFAAAR